MDQLGRFRSAGRRVAALAAVAVFTFGCTAQAPAGSTGASATAPATSSASAAPSAAATATAAASPTVSAAAPSPVETSAAPSAAPSQSAAPSASEAPSAAPSGSAAAGEPVEVSIWTAYGPQLQPAIDAYNADQQAAGRNVKIVATELGLDSISDKFAVAMTTGDVPDILDIDLVLAPKFTSQDALLDITDRVAAAGFGPDFNPRFADLGVWDGKTYMIPFSADVSALYYNKAIFKQAGLDPEAPPQTWEDFRAALDKIKAAGLKTESGNPVYPFAASSDAGSRMFCDMPFVWTGGGDWLNDAGEVIFDNADTQKGMEWLTGIYTTEGMTPPNPQSATWDDKMQAFYSGQAAVICSGSYVVNEVKEKAPDLDYGLMLFPHPTGQGDVSSFIGGDVIGIPAKSKHPEEAWDFIQYALSEKVQVEIWAKSGLPPVRQSLAKNKYFDEAPIYYTFGEGVAKGRVPKTTHYQALYDPWKSAWDAIFAGTSVDQALKEAAEAMREIVSR